MLAKDELLQTYQSETINLLRFPMAVLVILIHTDWYYASWQTDINLMSGEGLCFLLGYIFRVLAEISVPTFFIFSGFLFFNNFREFTWNGYKKKLESRFNTLVIPYIMWNVLVYVFGIIGKVWDVASNGASWDVVTSFLIKNNIRFLWDIIHWGDTNRLWMWWTVYSTGPIDSPLWFLRDLIVVTILSPLIYWLVNRTKGFVVLILLLSYVSGFWVVWHGFGIEAFFFFTLGAYFAINKINLVEFCQKKYGLFIILLTVCLGIEIFSWIPADYMCIVRKLLYVSIIFSVISIASYLVTKKRFRANQHLVASCFFIYACHLANLIITPVSAVYILVSVVISGDGYLEQFVRFITVPIVTAAVLFFAYVMLMRFMPKVGRFFCGGR